jgi:hypothetical protein
VGVVGVGDSWIHAHSKDFGGLQVWFDLWGQFSLRFLGGSAFGHASISVELDWSFRVEVRFWYELLFFW